MSEIFLIVNKKNMKTKVNSARRIFMEKLGIGALSAGILGSIPFKLFAMTNSAKGKSKQKISISINPMAVKRTRKS